MSAPLIVPSAARRAVEAQTLPAPISEAPDALSLRQRRRIRASAEKLKTAGGALYALSKRALDVFASGMALLILSPLFLLVAFLIKREDGGPVLYTQTRIGKLGQPFTFYKFRSMRVTADEEREELVDDEERRFKDEDDPRITRVGRWIRRLSVDEMPQFFNVLRGEMTLVGPRPPIPEEVEQYTPGECRRLAVEQGLTCTWQVSGRSDIPFEEQVELDLDYIRQRSFAFDLELLLRTVPAVLSGRVAY